MLYNALDFPAGVVPVTMVTDKDEEELKGYQGYFRDWWDRTLAKVSGARFPRGMSIPIPSSGHPPALSLSVCATGFSWQCGAASGRAVRGLAMAGGAVPPVHEGGGDPHPEEKQARLSPVRSPGAGSQLTSAQVILWSDSPAGLMFPSTRMQRWLGWLLALGCKGKARQAPQWWSTSSHCPNTVFFIIRTSYFRSVFVWGVGVDFKNPLSTPREV